MLGLGTECAMANKFAQAVSSLPGAAKSQMLIRQKRKLTTFGDVSDLNAQPPYRRTSASPKQKESSNGIAEIFVEDLSGGSNWLHCWCADVPHAGREGPTICTILRYG